MIDKFDGDYAFLSNFYYSPFMFQGRQYPTVEHFFQAHKAKTYEDFISVLVEPSPKGAKQVGRKIKMREDWDAVKDTIMLEGLRAKFSIKGLREKLLATGDEELIEGNHWHDTYWGVCNGVGKNKLGKMLMQVREEIRK